MTYKPLHALVVGSLVLACLGPFTPSQSLLALPETYSAQAVPNTVEVTFDGLMVFRRVGNHYEVGILDENTAINHELKVTIGETPISSAKLAKFLNSGNQWSLDVVSASGKKAPDIKPRQNKQCSRLQDTKDGLVDIDHVFDFCWIMDLETEFHGGKALVLKPKKLKPIIKLNNGQLYTKYNYDELERVKGHSTTYTPFGFVADMLALRVDLKDNEKLELTVGNQVVFSLTPNGERSAGIFNAPKGPDMGESHFRYYYNLFDVPDSEQYDIRLWKEMKDRHPLNRYFGRQPSDKDFNAFDKLRILTFDNQMCGAVFLGKSADPLQ